MLRMLCVRFRFHSAPGFGRFVPAPPYAEGAKNLGGLSQNMKIKTEGKFNLNSYIDIKLA